MQFEIEYNKYKDDVYRLAYSYTLNRQDAEDILQKTFLQLYKNIHKFSNTESLKHWLIVVTVNNCKNILISSWKNKVIHPEDFQALDKENITNYSLVASVMSKLKKSYRIPFYLSLIYGYTTSEIAGIMNLTDAAVKMRLKRAKEILKMEWEEN